MIGVRLDNGEHVPKPKKNVRRSPRMRESKPVTLLTPDGRLPGFAQRRLDDLIARNKTPKGLSALEKQELEEALDYMDRKNAEILKRDLSESTTV